MTTSIPCNIALLPDKSLAEKAIAAAAALSDENKTAFKLSEARCSRHITIYRCQLKTEDLEFVRAILRDLSASLVPFELTALNFGNEERYFDVTYERTDQIANLQQEVITSINPLRDGMREEDKLRLENTTGVPRDNLEKYGWRNVEALYKPHLTLTRFVDPGDFVLPDGFESATEYSGLFDRIGIFSTGDNGTAVDEIAVYKLRGK